MGEIVRILYNSDSQKRELDMLIQVFPDKKDDLTKSFNQAVLARDARTAVLEERNPPSPSK